MALGRPQSEVDWVQFEKLVWIPVLSNVHLADVLGVSVKTLERRVREKYDDTIDGIRQQKQGPMRQNLFSAMWKNAMSGNVTSQIWLSKNIFGWSDKMVHAQGDVTQEKLIINFSGVKNTPDTNTVDSREPLSKSDQDPSQGSGDTPQPVQVQAVVQDHLGGGFKNPDSRDPGTADAKS